jgi:cytoskeletal protein CcmA (bactofilin family)
MTHLGPSIRINGDVSSEEDLTIHGHVSGRVLLRDHTVVIAPEARINAEVRGARVIVLGEVRGAVTAASRIELGPSSTAAGSLSANQVVLVEGARFTGRIDMGQRTIAAKVASYKAAHSG